MDTLDPMSAIIFILRDQKRQIYAQDFAMFDGIRRVKIKFTHGEETSDGHLNCHGIYTRMGGYSAKELKDGRNFPFNVKYEYSKRILQGHLFSIETNRGRAKFVRR